MTNRAVRGLELLDANPAISFDDFSAIKHDNAYSPNYRGHAYLSVVANLEAIDDDEAQAIALIREWDLHTDMANRHAALGVCVCSRNGKRSGLVIRSPMPVKHFTNVRHRSVTCLDVWIPSGAPFSGTGAIIEHGLRPAAPTPCAPCTQSNSTMRMTL